MCQKKPFSSSLGIFTNLYTIFTDFSPSRSQQQLLEEAKSFPPFLHSKVKESIRQGLLQPRSPKAKLTAKGLQAFSLSTALPTPCTLQVSLLTTEFNPGKEHKDFRHILQIQKPMDLLRSCLLCKGC